MKYLEKYVNNSFLGNNIYIIYLSFRKYYYFLYIEFKLFKKIKSI